MCEKNFPQKNAIFIPWVSWIYCKMFYDETAEYDLDSAAMKIGNIYIQNQVFT